MAEPQPVIFPLQGRRVWIAGDRGMVGSALTRRLARERCQMLSVGRGEVDLRRQVDVERWIAANAPEVVFVAAATVGGILANDTRPAEFLYDNLMIAGNIVEAQKGAILAALSITDELFDAREAGEDLAGSMKRLSAEIRPWLPPAKRKD